MANQLPELTWVDLRQTYEIGSLAFRGQFDQRPIQRTARRVHLEPRRRDDPAHRPSEVLGLHQTRLDFLRHLLQPGQVLELPLRNHAHFHLGRDLAPLCVDLLMLL
jgi:hypothetical protein